MTSMNDAVQMVKLGDNLLVPLDALPQALKNRWQIAQSKAAAGENVKGVLATLLREIQGVVGVDVLLRAAPRMSAMTIGMTDKDATAHGATFRSLSATADAEADSEKRKEGVKPSAGKTRCPLCGK